MKYNCEYAVRARLTGGRKVLLPSSSGDTVLHSKQEALKVLNFFDNKTYKGKEIQSKKIIKRLVSPWVDD